MRGLTIIVTGASTDRFRSALNLALANAALGGRTRLFLDGAAVSLARAPIACGNDEAHAAAGLPTLAALYAEALDAGVRPILCQSGLAMTGGMPGDHDPRVDYAGLVSLLQTLGEDRLATI